MSERTWAPRSPLRAFNEIACLMCHGCGYIVRHTMDGKPFPVTCGACGGEGVQTVRPS